MNKIKTRGELDNKIITPHACNLTLQLNKRFSALKQNESDKLTSTWCCYYITATLKNETIYGIISLLKLQILLQKIMLQIEMMNER